MVSARCSGTQHEHYGKTAERLGVDVSRLLLTTMDVVTERVEQGDWSSFRVYLDELEIVGVGEVPPMTEGGQVLEGLTVVDLIAPAWLQRQLARQLGA